MVAKFMNNSGQVILSEVDQKLFKLTPLIILRFCQHFYFHQYFSEVSEILSIEFQK